MSPPDDKQRELLRKLPQVNELLELVSSREGARAYTRRVLLASARTVIDAARKEVLRGTDEGAAPDLEIEVLAEKVEEEATRLNELRLRRVINATGVVLHTNLGRAPLSRRALEAVVEASGGYCNLEYDLEGGTRGSRQDHMRPLLVELTGAGDALVVNNNAAAVLLTLAALARGREVIVSRGQLVEIGGSFRLPEIMRQSGAVLVEVGTTNITRAEDYRNAIGPETALIMRIHQSNFRIVGYSEEVPLSELVEVGRQQSVPVVEDLGSGTMEDLEGFGLAGEPAVGRSIEAGADLVTFSGDKLLGGPQAGIVVGKQEYIDALRRHPMARALRVDKMTVAALEETLVEHLDPDAAVDTVPALAMLSEEESSILSRARRCLRRLKAVMPDGLDGRVVADVSRPGGGTLPAATLPTHCLAITHETLDAASLEARLRRGEPAVMGRIHEGVLLLDLRTVPEEETNDLVRAVSNLR